ncbi:MAG: zinc-ribbon domain-containing protein [Paracoccaceae bacterium]
MRLICPNCDAQYEVDAAAIPVAGRDVQCSNCGHTWFQIPPEVEAEQAEEAALYDAPEGESPAEVSAQAEVAANSVPDGAPAQVETAAQDPDLTVIAQLSDAPPLPPAPANPAPADTNPTDPAAAVQRQIDESVLAVLREEAEREMIARRLDAQAIETQQEMGIEAAVAATVQQDATQRHLARLKGEDTPDVPLHAAKRELTRREMLPDIEEINSSLRPGDVAVNDDGEAFEIVRRPEPGRSSFRSGFVLMLVLGLIALLAYVMAPQISAQLPAAKPAMDGYVTAVDAGRTWLDGATRGLITNLRGAMANDAP